MGVLKGYISERNANVFLLDYLLSILIVSMNSTDSCKIKMMCRSIS